jgi:hypothetical protein
VNTKYKEQITSCMVRKFISIAVAYFFLFFDSFISLKLSTWKKKRLS